MDPDYHWLITAGLVTSSAIALVANCFLLVIFCRRRGLRTVPNRFIINLLVTNLLSSLLLIPLLLTDQEVTHELLLNSTRKTNETEKHASAPTPNNFIGSIKDAMVKNNTIIPKSAISQTELLGQTSRKCLCYFAQSSTTFVCTASIFSILLIGINQYFGVIHSLRYHVFINKCRSTILILSSWFVAFLFSLLGSLIKIDNNLWHFCDKNSVEHSSSIRILNTTYAFAYFIFVILVPFLAICIIYICIYKAAHKNSERMRKSTSSSCNLDTYVQLTPDIAKAMSKETPLHEASPPRFPKVHSAPDFTRLAVKETQTEDSNIGNETPGITFGNQTPTITIGDETPSISVGSETPRIYLGNETPKICTTPTSTNILISIKHKISNASVFRYREETRAAKISFIVIFMVFFCYVPYGVTLILNAELIDVTTSDVLNYISIILLTISNVISPFLFGYRNKRVKREICKVFGLKKRGQNLANHAGANMSRRQSTVFRGKSMENLDEEIINRPFLDGDYVIPKVIVTCKPENGRKSILKRVCDSSNWTSYKKCNFITVPDSCISGEARGSFSSASTQISSEGS